MTKAHPEFQGLSRSQMRDIYHALNRDKTVRQLAIRYGVTERTIMAARREVRRTLLRSPRPAGALV